MLRLKNLGSGSAGNATLIEGSDGLRTRRLLVDCGLGVRQLAARLDQAGLAWSDIAAIFITHEHSDHIGCARSIALKHRIPIWMSHGTHAALGSPDFNGLLCIAHDLEPIDLGCWQATPFTVPHDAREPLQLRGTDGAVHLGILTDLGHASEHVKTQLAGCHTLLVEANHDPAMLAASRYPLFLQRRIAGPYGHMANTATAELLAALKHPSLGHVVAAHLSAHNNTPALAQEALASALDWPPERIGVASQTEGTPWITVGMAG